MGKSSLEKHSKEMYEALCAVEKYDLAIRNRANDEKFEDMELRPDIAIARGVDLDELFWGFAQKMQHVLYKVRMNK